MVRRAISETPQTSVGSPWRRKLLLLCGGGLSLAGTLLSLAPQALLGRRPAQVELDARLPQHEDRLVAAARQAAALAPKGVDDPARVPIFGTVVSHRGDTLVVHRKGSLLSATNATVVDAVPDADVAVQVPPDAIVGGGGTVLAPGLPVFVGASRGGDGLVANVVLDLSGGQPVDVPPGWADGARTTVTQHPAAAPPPAAAAGDGGSKAGSRRAELAAQETPPMCDQISGYTPPASALNFTGCFGGPSFTYSTDLPDIFFWSFVGLANAYLTGFHVTFAAAGWTYDFPFQFEAIPTGDLFVGQNGSVDVNVTALSPDPAFSYVGGLGFNVGIDLRLQYVCADGYCDYYTTIPLNAFSSIVETKEAPPLGAGQSVSIDTVGCPDVSFGIPGAKETDILALKFCLPYTLHGKNFEADISADGATVSAGRLSFDGAWQRISVVPTSTDLGLHFSNFRYVPDLEDQLQFRLAAGPTGLRKTFWESDRLSLTTGSFEAITTPFPVPGSGFSGGHPEDMKIPLTARPTVTSVTPARGSADGGSVELTGTGFTNATVVRLYRDAWSFTPVFNSDFTVHSDYSMTVNLPPGDVGDVDVVVAAGCGQDCRLESPRSAATRYRYMARTKVALESSGTPTDYRESVTFTATVSPDTAGYDGTPTGTVRFLINDSGFLGDIPLSSGRATLTAPDWLPGTWKVTAIYNGDDFFMGGRSSVTQTIRGVATAVSMSASPNPSENGETVTFNVSVDAEVPGSTGAVAVKGEWGGVVASADDLTVPGVVTLTSSALPVGDHTLTAEFLPRDIVLTPASSPPVAHTVSAVPSTVVLTSSANPSWSGQQVVVTATVDGATGGQVIFSDGDRQLGFAAIDNGKATFTSSSFSVGTHALTARFDGDSVHTAATSPVLSQVVAKVPTKLTLKSSDNVSEYGEPLTFTATLSFPSEAGVGLIEGLVRFYDGDVKLGDASVVDRAAVWPVPRMSVGGRTIRAVYTGSSTLEASAQSTAQAVVAVSTTVTLSASPSPSQLGEEVALRAVVNPSSSNAGTPRGRVQFKDGDTLLGAPVQLPPFSNEASLRWPLNTGGAHTLTAAYLGTSDFQPSAGSVSHSVQRQGSTVTVRSEPSSSVFGQTVTLTAEVRPAAAAPTTPGGLVQFRSGTADIGSPVPLTAAGVATLQWRDFHVGDNAIVAVYAGDASFDGATSPAASQGVARAKTNTVVSSSGTPSQPLAPVTFTAEVRVVMPGAGRPAGAVQFASGGTKLGQPVALVDGKATSPAFVQRPGRYAVTATYLGEVAFEPSTGTLNPVVEPSASSVVLTSSANPSNFGSSVTFTATVAPVTAGVGTPTGSVRFTAGAASLGVVGLSDGVAKLALADLSPGRTTVTATYVGSSFFTASSASLEQRVVLDAGGPYQGTEGAPVPVSSVGGGPSGITWTVAAASGVDPGAQCAVADPGAAATTVTCTDDGNYTLTLTVNGTDPAVTATARLTIGNAAPSAALASSQTGSPYRLGSPVEVAATFTDPGTADTHVCSVLWGDGTSGTATVNESAGSGGCRASRTYGGPGVYDVTLTVVDDDGGQAGPLRLSVVVYDPDAGFLTGAGAIDSRGAYRADPAYAGPARFNVNSGYHKGDTAPWGRVELELRDAKVAFQTTALDWLVISGARAQLAGSGTVNGAAGYRVVLTAGDGAPDGLRVVITDSTGAVFYDNAPGTRNDLNQTSLPAVVEGNLTVHS